VEELEFDVSGAVGEAAVLSGSLFEAEAAETLFVCLPGGTQDRRYFDLALPGYSFADFMFSHGVSVAAFDNFGTGRSSHPDREVGFDLQAAATAIAVDQLRARLRRPKVVAVAHSIGGYIAMRQQATHRSYDALAILGTTNFRIGTIMITDDEMEAAKQGADARRALVERNLAAIPDRYFTPDRESLTRPFHLPDVAPEVLELDSKTVVNQCRLAAAEAGVSGITRDDAAMIDVPVLLAYGDADVSPAPQDEPSVFVSSPDVTLFVLVGSGHCHNMAPTRHRLWERIVAWNAATN
jgi:alpha-beta hydrolase superfamily lysophospholipase